MGGIQALSEDQKNWIAVFDEARPRLEGLAYRILGSVAEAEDVVQDTFLKWQAADRAAIRTPAAWLTTVCTRRALDLLKSAHRERVSYVGTWLPEPLHTADEVTQEDAHELVSNLSVAFMLLLERLSPKERAAYLLYEIFDSSHGEIASMLDMTEAAVRKLVSRARTHVGDEKARYRPEADRQELLLGTFQNAIETGQTETLASMLAEDVELRADGGGKVIAVTEAITNRRHILRFIGNVLSKGWRGSSVETIGLNGQKGLVYRHDGAIHTVVSFAYDEQGAVTDLFLVRNPEKIKLLEKRLG